MGLPPATRLRIQTMKQAGIGDEITANIIIVCLHSRWRYLVINNLSDVKQNSCGLLSTLAPNLSPPPLSTWLAKILWPKFHHKQAIDDPYWFLQRHAMHTCDHAVVRWLAGWLSVRPSVTLVCSIEKSKYILKLFFTLWWSHNSSLSVRNLLKFQRCPP